MLQRFNFSFLWFSSKRSLARFLGEKNPFELTRMDNFWAHSPRILILGSGASPAYLILVYYIAEKRQRRLFRNEEMSEEEEKKTYWTQINFYSSPHFKLNYAPLAENISSILQKWRLGSFILSQSQTHSSMVILTASANKQKRQKCQIKSSSPPLLRFKEVRRLPKFKIKRRAAEPRKKTRMPFAGKECSRKNYLNSKWHNNANGTRKEKYVAEIHIRTYMASFITNCLKNDLLEDWRRLKCISEGDFH